MILTAASAGSVVMAQEKVCSTFCTSLGMLNVLIGHLMVTPQVLSVMGSTKYS